MPSYDVMLKSVEKGSDGEFKYKNFRTSAENEEEAKTKILALEENTGFTVWMVSQPFPYKMKKAYCSEEGVLCETQERAIICPNCRYLVSYDASQEHMGVVCPECGTVVIAGKPVRPEEGGLQNDS